MSNKRCQNAASSAGHYCFSVITATQEIEVKGPVEPTRFRPGKTIGPLSKVKKKYLSQCQKTADLEFRKW